MTVARAVLTQWNVHVRVLTDRYVYTCKNGNYM